MFYKKAFINRVLLLHIVCASLIFGGEYEEWIKQNQGGSNQLQDEFRAYKTNADNDFANALKADEENWQTFKTQLNKPLLKSKPIKLPIAPSKKPQNIKGKTSIPNVPKAIKNHKKQLSLHKTPNKMPKLQIDDKHSSFVIDFFYNKITIAYNKNLKIKNYKANRQSISNFYSYLNNQDLNTLQKSIIYNKNYLRLNDWGLYLLVDKIAKKLQLNKNTQSLFSWYMMLKLGYDVKISYSNSGDIFLLANVKQKLYQVPYYTFNNKPYYILSPKGYLKLTPSITTYKVQIRNNLKPLDMSNYFVPKTNKKYDTTREISFKYAGKKYHFKISYNKGLSNYYDTFAQVDYGVYLNTNMYKSTYNDFKAQLEPIIKNKSEIWAVNFLLALVQKGFKYKTDNAQFGREKPLFVAQSLYYPYSDCEDRVILFSRLVNDLLGLKIVAIKYSNHLSSAVLLSGLKAIKSGYVVHKNQKYIIADPTYINASVGMIMPAYKNARYSLIEQN